MPYPIPPWIPDSASQAGPLFAQGLNTGVGVAEANARMQQQAAMATMEAAQRQQEMEARAQQMSQERLMEQQRIDIAKQQAEMEQGLRQKEFQQHQQIVDLQTQQAARQFAAHQRYKQLLDAGEDPAKALLDVGPDLGISMTGAAQLYKQTHMPNIPPEVVNFDGEKFLKTPTGSGNFEYHPLRPPVDSTQKAIYLGQIRDLERQRDALMKEHNSPTNLGIAAASIPDDQIKTPIQRAAKKQYLDEAAQIKELQDQIMQLRQQSGVTLPSAAVPPDGGPSGITPAATAAGTNAPIRILSITPAAATPAKSDTEINADLDKVAAQWPGFGGQ